MAGEDNLIPMSERSKDEVREIAAKGGRNSGKVRRERKAMRESLEIILGLALEDDKEACDIDELKSYASLKGKNITVEQAMIIAQVKKALKGDTQAFTTLRDTSGQAPNQKVDITGAVPVVISGEDNLED